MDQRIKGIWIERLRSGDYPQGRDLLAQYVGDTDEMTFCCLGVLCEIAEEEGVVVSLVFEGIDCRRKRYLGPGESENGACGATLPECVEAWAGLGLGDQLIPLPGAEGGKIALAELNDRGIIDRDGRANPWTFDQIADVVDRHL